MTPDALAEKRRKLVEREAAAAEALPEEEKRRQLVPSLFDAPGASRARKALSRQHKGLRMGLKQMVVADGNPCRRRLQLGVQGCVGWGHGETESFSVSMSRSANRRPGTRTPCLFP